MRVYLENYGRVRNMKSPSKRSQQIAKLLIEYEEQYDASEDDASNIEVSTLQGANSFLIGVLLDRQIPWKNAWAAGKRIAKSVQGKVSEAEFWKSLTDLSQEEIEGFMHYGWGGKPFHRFWKDMAKNLWECAKRIERKYAGDPRNIWKGERSISEIRECFEELPGFGLVLSRMAVLILVYDCGLLGGKSSLRELDIKLDVHLKRVFKRTGLVSENPSIDDFLEAARKLNPDFPGALDLPAWRISWNFCHPQKPKCEECPLNGVCPKIGV